MQLRSGKIVSKTDAKTKKVGAHTFMHFCGHECQLWYKHKCCTCMDKRPKNAVTMSFSQAWVKDAKVANRKIGYCPQCRKT